MKTLIIIDVQHDFMPGGPLAVPHGDAVVPVINSLQGSFDLIVATQDWHPADHISFASNHSNRKPFEEIRIGSINQVLWPDHCIQGTGGAALHEALKTDRIAAIFRKGMDPWIDSYSGFYDNGHLKSTGLAGYLREMQAAEIYLCGLAADICVYFTLKDAINEGFAVSLIEDACRPLDNDSFQTLKKEIAGMGGKITTANSLS